MPNLIAYDICGVQPMNGPTGLIFAMRSRYNDQSGSENFYNEVDSAFSGQDAGFNALNGATDASVGFGYNRSAWFQSFRSGSFKPGKQTVKNLAAMLTTLVKVSVPTTLKVWAKLSLQPDGFSASRKSP